MSKLSLTKLKKNLESKTKDELIKEISTLYQKFSQVKDYYEMQQADTNDVLQKYKEIIKKEFIDGKTRGLPKHRLSVARKAIADFKKITKDPELLADLMFIFVESVADFNSTFGVDSESYYTSSENMFEAVLKLLKKYNLLSKYQRRASNILDNAPDGFGHCDSLRSSYEDFYGRFPK